MSQHHKEATLKQGKSRAPFRTRGKSPVGAFRRLLSRGGSSSSFSDSEEKPNQFKTKSKHCIIVYHESANSIVFRDHVRRAAKIIEEEEESSSSSSSSDDDSTSGSSDDGKEYFVELRKTVRESIRASSKNDNGKVTRPSIENPAVREVVGQSVRDLASTMKIKPELMEASSSSMSSYISERKSVHIGSLEKHMTPLPPLELGPESEFEPLLKKDTKDSELTLAEKEVCRLLKEQKACVKTIKNSEWTSFLKRFLVPHIPSKKSSSHRYPNQHKDIPPQHEGDFNSFVTSTSLLPECGQKMRCFGSTTSYTVGVVFALPESFASNETEDQAAQRTQTWSWPAGYSAKTEFNIDIKGRLINGRQEALVPFSKMRQYNDEYLHKQDHMIGGKLVKGGYKIIPYNEIFLRVGGSPRIVQEKDCATGRDRKDNGTNTGRSFDGGVGLPVALFIRTNQMGDIISLLRNRARMSHVLGGKHTTGIPLVLISHELGIRVFSESLQHKFLRIAARKLNPFQNPSLERQTKMNDTNEACLKQKLEELVDWGEAIRKKLPPEECTRIAGGFGATDEAVAAVLTETMLLDKRGASGNRFRTLPDIVQEGLAGTVRSGDYYTARQFLILYARVAAQGFKEDTPESDTRVLSNRIVEKITPASMYSDTSLVENCKGQIALPLPPLPPPLHIDRLRNATNDDGLIVVFGASQILSGIEGGGTKLRTKESFEAVEKWIEHGEQSVAFRVASWHEQRVAQGDSRIATNNDSKLMAFAGNKAITNRKRFAAQLRRAASQHDSSGAHFLREVHEILSNMHSPCLRLELIQYILGLDNRYSVTLAKLSIELAATCMSAAAG